MTTPAREWIDKQIEIANRFAQWIDACPLPPSELHDAYDAHVLLCELIRQSADAPDLRVRDWPEGRG